MEYMACPRCREKSVPVGKNACELCGWKAKQKSVVKQQSTPEPVPEQKPEIKVDRTVGKKTCSESDCNEPVLSKGLCKKHYWKKKSKERQQKKQAEKQPDQVVKASHPEQTKEEKSMPEPTIQTEPVARRSSSNHSNAIKTIDVKFYARDKSILKTIEESAVYNRRSLNQEILFRLENGVSA